MNAVKNIVMKLEEKFGKMSSKSYGTEYYFLGMKLSFVNKKVRFDMIEYLHEAAKDFGEELTGLVTPARNNLKSVDPKSPLVNENKRFFFHSAVMLIMCVSQR